MRALGRVSAVPIVLCVGLRILAGCDGKTHTAAPVGAVPALSTRSAATTGETVTISIRDFKFSPPSLVVSVGTKVTWKNLDGEPHTVRGADARIRSSALDQNETYVVTLDQPGVYNYGCSIHPKMAGSIVVQ